jgi:hypothetical protein
MRPGACLHRAVIFKDTIFLIEDRCRPAHSLTLWAVDCVFWESPFNFQDLVEVDMER